MKKTRKNTVLDGIKADFITDAKGRKKQVVLGIAQFKELLETLEDYHDIAQAAVKKHSQSKGDRLEVVRKRLLG